MQIVSVVPMLVECPSYRSKNKYFAGHPPSNIREASISRIASISRGMPAKAMTPATAEQKARNTRNSRISVVERLLL